MSVFPLCREDGKLENESIFCNLLHFGYIITKLYLIFNINLYFFLSFYFLDNHLQTIILLSAVSFLQFASFSFDFQQACILSVP